MVSLHQYFRFSRDLLEQWTILLKSLSWIENDEAHSRTSCLVGNFIFPFCVFFFYLTWSQVRYFVTCQAGNLTREAPTESCLFLAASRVCIRSLFFQQNFWLFTNWRQELSYTLHILQTPKQTGLVLARDLIRLHRLFRCCSCAKLKIYLIKDPGNSDKTFKPWAVVFVSGSKLHIKWWARCFLTSIRGRNFKQKWNPSPNLCLQQLNLSSQMKVKYLR